MAGLTYEPIATTTLGSDSSSVTFSSISGAYTDLVMVANHKWASGTRVSLCMQFNNDTSTASYSDVGLYATGTTVSTGKETLNGCNFLGVTSDQWQLTTLNFADYANTTTKKSFLSRSNSLGTSATQNITAMVHMWSSTSAISTIKIYPLSGNFLTGSVFTLFGILGS